MRSGNLRLDRLVNEVPCIHAVYNITIKEESEQTKH